MGKKYLYVSKFCLTRLHGSSGSCETFGNSCLAYSPEFELKNVEVRNFLFQLHIDKVLNRGQSP